MSLLGKSKEKLELLGFDASEVKGVYVKFDENKKEYLYVIGIEESIKPNDYVVAPVYDNRQLKLAKVVSVFDNENKITEKNFNQISKSVENILSLDIKPSEKHPLLRRIALNIFSEEDVYLSPYFERLDKIDRKKQLLTKLEKAAEEEAELAKYRVLSRISPKMRELMDELDSLED